MSCNKCNLSKCGCQDSYLTTPPPCPVPSDCPEVQPCSESFNAECIVYTGLPITCGLVEVVSTNSSVSDALASITSFLCDEVTVDNNILCNLDVVVPAYTLVEDALVLIVTYFCSNLITDIQVSEVATTDVNGCITTVYTVENNNGVGVDAVTLSSFEFSVGPVCPVGVFTATADGIVTGAIGDIVGTGLGSMTFLANSLVVGDTFMLKVFGEVTKTFAGPIATINIMYGGGGGGVTLMSNTNAQGGTFSIETEIVVRSIGASGVIQIGGSIHDESAGIGPISINNLVVDTTVDKLLWVEGSWDITNAGNSISSQIVSLTKIF
jgi:hypothetical protein